MYLVVEYMKKGDLINVLKSRDPSGVDETGCYSSLRKSSSLEIALTSIFFYFRILKYQYYLYHY